MTRLRPCYPSRRQLQVSLLSLTRREFFRQTNKSGMCQMRFKYLCILFQSAVRLYLFMQIFLILAAWSCQAAANVKGQGKHTQIMPCSGLSSKNKRWQWGPWSLSGSCKVAGLPVCLSALNSAPQQNVTPPDFGQCLLLWLQREKLTKTPAVVLSCHELEWHCGGSALGHGYFSPARSWGGGGVMEGVCVRVRQKTCGRFREPGVWSPSLVSCPNNVL